jgi:cobalamin biosynthesis Mg chelatase CobN
MFVNAKALVLIVSCALVAQAQSTTTATAPSSQPSLDACIVGCLTQALPSGPCTSYTDLTCVCTSTGYQEAAAACLTANCTATDLATAEALQIQECSAVSSGSGSVPASTAASTAASSGTPTSAGSSGTPTSAGSSGTSKSAASSGTSASATQSATSTSAAMALSAPFSLGSLVGTLVASAGALVGAAFVL